MHRRPLLELLNRYVGLHSDERATVERIRSLVERHTDCFERSCLPGHVTASAWVVSPDGERCLLTHHRKLERWLQLGGHADGDPDVRAVALRELQEESGMRDFEWLPTRGASRAAVLDSTLLDITPLDSTPLDVDVHTIPARRDEPSHEHHDIRFLLRARPGQRLRISDESNDLQWIEVDRLSSFTREESVLRLARKARPWLDLAG